MSLALLFLEGLFPGLPVPALWFPMGLFPELPVPGRWFPVGLFPELPALYLLHRQNSKDYIHKLPDTHRQFLETSKCLTDQAQCTLLLF